MTPSVTQTLISSYAACRAVCETQEGPHWSTLHAGLSPANTDNRAMFRSARWLHYRIARAIYRECALIMCQGEDVGNEKNTSDWIICPGSLIRTTCIPSSERSSYRSGVVRASVPYMSLMTNARLIHSIAHGTIQP
jgi:hypothetical protein